MALIFDYEEPAAIGKAQVAEKLGYCNAKYFFRQYVHRDLLPQLLATGYRPRQKWLTQRQCRIIYDFYGYPIKEAGNGKH